MDELSTRNYDVKDIGENDQRFVDCRKEGVLLATTCGIVTVVGCTISYLLSPSLKNAASNTYLFGYPTWAMVPCLLFAAQALFFIWYASKKMKRCSLEARAENPMEEVTNL
jgi:hypothetical protein